MVVLFKRDFSCFHKQMTVKQKFAIFVLGITFIYFGIFGFSGIVSNFHDEFPAYVYKPDTINTNLRFAWLHYFPHKLSKQRICFIVMAFSKRLQLHHAQKRTFLKNFPHVYAFADETDQIYVQTLDTIKGKTSYSDAQHRQLKGAQWLLQKHPNIVSLCDFFVFIDDDTWINTELLQRVLYTLKPIKKLLFGYFAWGQKINGGAGMIMSSDLFQEMMPMIYNHPKCPFDRANDDTITRCSIFLNATQLHTTQNPFYARLQKENVVDFGDKISLHKVNTVEEMILYTSEIKRVLELMHVDL